MSVADASSSDARAALLRHASCVLAPLAPRTPHSHTLFIYEPLSLAPPPPPDQILEHHLVAPTCCDDLPVATAERSLGPPAILDQPGFTHGIDIPGVDVQGSALVARADRNPSGHR
jgi:hypothetical protein